MKIVVGSIYGVKFVVLLTSLQALFL